MKKYLLSIYFIVGGYFFSFGQFKTYHPFPDSNSYWIEGSQLNNWPMFYYSQFNYFVKGDTVLFGKIYHKIYFLDGTYSSDNVRTGASSYSVYNNLSYCNAYREDTLRHIFLYCSSCLSHDTLLYDFNLKVGDTIPKYLSSIHYIDTVTSIDSTLIGLNYRKRYNIGSPAYDNIIEGIGSTNGLLESLHPYPAPYIYYLDCFMQNDVELYSMYVGDTCIPYNGTNILYDVSNVSDNHVDFSIFPNPGRSYISIQISTSIPIAGEINLFNSFGQLIKKERIFKNNAVYEENISNLPNGVYYFSVSQGGAIMATKKLVIIKQ